MASITIHRHAATGAACELPREEQEFWDAEPGHPEHVELRCELECADYDDEESEHGHVSVHAGVTDVEATARGWPVELTTAEYEAALELVNEEVCRA